MTENNNNTWAYINIGELVNFLTVLICGFIAIFYQNIWLDIFADVFILSWKPGICYNCRQTHVVNQYHSNAPDSKVHGAIIGPIWGRQDPGGPHVGPINFAIWSCNQQLRCKYWCGCDCCHHWFGNGCAIFGVKLLPKKKSFFFWMCLSNII